MWVSLEVLCYLPALYFLTEVLFSSLLRYSTHYFSGLLWLIKLKNLNKKPLGFIFISTIVHPILNIYTSIFKIYVLKKKVDFRVKCNSVSLYPTGKLRNDFCLRNFKLKHCITKFKNNFPHDLKHNKYDIKNKTKKVSIVKQIA